MMAEQMYAPIARPAASAAGNEPMYAPINPPQPQQQPDNLWAEAGKGALTAIPSIIGMAAPGIQPAVEAGLSTLHLNPNDYFPEPETWQGRLARAGGAGAATMLLPAGEFKAGATLFPRLAQVAKDIFAGGMGGITGQAAQEVTPEPYKPLANLAGNIIGGGG